MNFIIHNYSGSSKVQKCPSTSGPENTSHETSILMLVTVVIAFMTYIFFLQLCDFEYK